MKSIKYLYACDTAFWKDLQYVDALKEKNKCARYVIKAMLTKDWNKRTMYDIQRINDCLSAISHNERLINE